MPEASRNVWELCECKIGADSYSLKLAPTVSFRNCVFFFPIYFTTQQAIALLVPPCFPIVSGDVMEWINLIRILHVFFLF